jgi:predicted Zn-dependent peptidase
VARAPVTGKAAQRGITREEGRDTQQSHIAMATDTFDARDPRRYALAIIVNLLGGGMSSRLFQRVREELGLAYAVYAYSQLYQGAGTIGVYVGTQPATAEAAENAIREELLRLMRDGLSDQELAGGRQQLKGQVMLSLESPASRMHRLAATVLYQDRYRRLDQILTEIDAVDRDTIAALLVEYFDPSRWSAVRLGPLSSTPRPAS